MMGSLIAAAGALWVVVIMWDAFEALVLPRRVTRRLRPTRMFYRVTWRVWSAVARRMRPGGRRETYLSFYGPPSLLVLLSAWAVSLIVGSALVQWGIGSDLNVPGGRASFADDLYMSRTTFFTLGLGDITPRGRLARAITTLSSTRGPARRPARGSSCADTSGIRPPSSGSCTSGSGGRRNFSRAISPIRC